MKSRWVGKEREVPGLPPALAVLGETTPWVSASPPEKWAQGPAMVTHREPPLNQGSWSACSCPSHRRCHLDTAGGWDKVTSGFGAPFLSRPQGDSHRDGKGEEQLRRTQRQKETERPRQGRRDAWSQMLWRGRR